MKRLALLAIALGCVTPKPAPEPPKPLTSCEDQWIRVCLNAVDHGWGASYPDGCGYGPASAYCKGR